MKHLWYLILIILLISCKNKDSKNKLLKIDVIKTQTISIKDVSYQINTRPEIIQLNNKHYLTYISDFSFLNIISVDNPEIRRKIKIPIGDVFNVEFLNSDSILLVYNLHENFQDKYHLILIDTTGKVIKKVSLSRFLPCIKSYITITPFNAFFNQYYIFRIKTDERIIKPDKEQFCPQIAAYDFVNDTVIYNKELFYPDYPKNLHLKDNPEVIYISTFKNKNPLIRYVYSPYIYEWDIKNNKTTKHLIQSQIVDSIYNLNNYINAVFTEVKYNPYRGNFFFSCLPTLNEAEVYKTFFIVTDSLNNYITETTDIDYFNNVYFGKDMNINIRVSSDKIILTYFTYYFENVDKEEYIRYIDAIKKDLQKKQNEVPNLVCQIVNTNKLDTTTYDIKILLKKYFHLTDKNLLLLAMFSEKGCLTCNESLLEFLSRHYIFFKNNKLYVLLNVSKPYAKVLLDKYNFKDYPYLLLDTLNIYPYFNESHQYIPRLIKIKDDQKYFDRFYPLDEHDTLEMDLLKIAGKNN